MSNLSAALNVSITHLQAISQRIEAQLTFARQLVQWHPENADAWNKLIAQAEKLAAAAAKQGSREALESAANECEATLQPLAKTAKTYTIYCAGHAHIDMNWMWSWPETVAITHDTFATVIRLMEEFPEFRFSQSQASCYRIIEEHNPELLESIRKMVKAKKWEVTASHWVEGDKNLVSGDALVRHLVYARKYMAKLFDLRPDDVQIDWSPDTFGHPNTMPMYLSRGGIKYHYLHRPGAVRPEAFWWEAPDGSRVLVRNDQKRGYNGQINPDMLGSLVDFNKDTGLPYTLFMYGVGDHGGGPTRRDLLRARETNAWPIYPKIQLAMVKEFFRRLESDGAKLPVLTCELNTELSGCYTTQTLIKRSNRIAENRLMDLEAAATVAAKLAGHSYPHDKLEESWRDALFCHFHDILPGSNVHDSRTWMHGLFQKTIAMTSTAESLALRQLAAAVNTRKVAGDAPASDLPETRQATSLGAGVGFASDKWAMQASDQSSGAGPKPFIVFNSVATDREEMVEAVIWFDTHVWNITDEIRRRPWRVKLANGKTIAAQNLDSGNYWGHGFTRVAFPVSVGSLGYTTVVIEEGAAEPAAKDPKQIGRDHHCGYLIHEREPVGLENDLVALQLDTATGGIAMLLLHEAKYALIQQPKAVVQPLLEYAIERPHGMSAWLIDNTGPKVAPQLLKIEKRMTGPYAVSLDCRYRIEQSELTLTYELRTGDPRVYLHINGTWFQRGTPETGVPSLRLAIPIDLADVKATYDIPFGSITREHNRDQEQPALNWVRADGTAGEFKGGIALYNDSKHGHALESSANGSTLRMTLIRSSYDPDPLPEIGKQEIHLAIEPFAGELSDAHCSRTGRAFNRPLRVVSTTIHDGKLPTKYSALSVSPDSVVITSIRQTRQGAVVYLQNTTSEPVTPKITFHGRSAKLHCIDLLGRPAAEKKLRIAGRSIAAVLLQ